ncbi:unnamed protein product (macronuclear) [Paramecium tetraurelia]|uniref:Transmembrane protein n=1 Tax=Paramecium tetraurelia TaxID=5888 RepID=A0C201_PARTE|nr:uncharacterized protein GSPATT00034295001 [Paramecium tetraurelia]CAK64818.1 unnamed protein product [Paramecium tetraurelia]|eukprot:XP_001432215.1 hypothetical protein (macronuclear) [Paramecium tetraurelia strain d4-2]
MQMTQIDLKTIEVLSALLLFSCFTYLWFTFISLKFTIIIALTFCSLLVLLKIRWTRIKRTGFLNNISDKLRKILLERSLFDILCDIWYFETIKRHVRVFLSPFLIKKSPEEIIESFEDINPQLKEAILRKGTINLFPEPIKRELVENYIQEEDELQINQDKQMHQQIIQQPVKVEHWDRYGDYEEYTQRKRKNNSQTLLHVVSLLLHKPIVHKESHKVNLRKLSNKTKSLLIGSILCIGIQMYLSKSSRRIYQKAFTYLSSMSLLALASTALGVIALSNKKQKTL